MPKPTYQIKSYRGKPTLFMDGEPTPAYLYSHSLPIDRPGAERAQRRFVEHGCKFHMATIRGGVDGDWFTTEFWTDDNVFPDITQPDEAAKIHVARQANQILGMDPAVRFFVRFLSVSPPKRWREKNPDELLLDSFGKRLTDPSLGSTKYLEQVSRYVANAVRFCERQPWADRVVGYVLYPLGEGTTQLTVEGSLFDRSPAMHATFRRFLTAKYRTDAALREAWSRPDLTLQTVAVPDDRDFRARGLTRYVEVDTATPAGKPAPHRLHWPDPAETVAERDYCYCMRELTGRTLKALLEPIKREAPQKLAAIDGFKQTMLGWPLVARWTGDYQTHLGLMHAVSGAFGMAEFLDLPELDAVATPHDYLNRNMGFGYEGEGIGDSVVLHGKMMMMEEDQRTYAVDDPTFNPFADHAEAHAGFWRNLGASVSRGYNTYITEMVMKGSWYDDDFIQQVLAERRIVHEAATGWERREVPSIVMVVDDWSVLEEDFSIGYQHLAVIQQRLSGLSRCGVPFRVHLLEDLAADNFPDCHKVFLFPNLFRITPERLALLRRRVFRNGNVAIFGPASGLTDGRQLSAATATELTGIPLELVRRESPRWVTLDRFDHPITRNLPRLDYGDSFAYGPILMPKADPSVKRLGGIQWPHAWDGAGLVIREFGDYTTIFSCAVPLPDVLLREIARYSGTHIYGEADDVIFADSCTLTVHSVRPGKRTIRLPAPTPVWDVIARKQISKMTSVIDLDVQPPQTRMFYLGDKPFA